MQGHGYSWKPSDVALQLTRVTPHFPKNNNGKAITVLFTLVLCNPVSRKGQATIKHHINQAVWEGLPISLKVIRQYQLGGGLDCKYFTDKTSLLNHVRIVSKHCMPRSHIIAAFMLHTTKTRSSHFQAQAVNQILNTNPGQIIFQSQMVQISTSRLKALVNI